MRPSELLKLKRNEILALAAKAGARNVRVFGSAARGNDSEESDVDLLVVGEVVKRISPETKASDYRPPPQAWGIYPLVFNRT